MTLEPALLSALTARDYPGNVRELENLITRLVALSDGGPLGQGLLEEPVAALAPAARGVDAGSFRERVEALERSLLSQALSAASGNQSEAARQLGLSRATFLDKLKRYGVRVATLRAMTLLAILALGFFLGMRHATDSDHVLAVTAIVSRARSARAALWVGGLWGLGHTATILTVGGAIVLFGWVIPARLGLSLEMSVAVMLIALGAMNLSGALRRINEVAHGHRHDPRPRPRREPPTSAATNVFLGRRKACRPPQGRTSSGHCDPCSWRGARTGWFGRPSRYWC